MRYKSWEGTPEEESLEATWENEHRGCGRDMLQRGRPDCRRWTAVYDGHSATLRKQIEGVSRPR